VPTQDRATLFQAAYDVADEFRNGKFSFKSGDWTVIRETLLKELERRCPGFSRADYDAALKEGYKDSR
jgi:hypothetical protein